MPEDRPSVGVAVLIRKEMKVLLGLLCTAQGEGTWGTPRGHLEFGEGFEECARRDVREETGLEIANLSQGTVTNDVFEEDGEHAITIFMVADYVEGTPVVLERDRCDQWEWFHWHELPENLFPPLKHAIAAGFNPFQEKQVGFL